MITIKIPATTVWDDNEDAFIDISACEILLEHSLVAMSKWESKWCIPFLSKENKTYEQTIDYVKCMTINEIDETVYTCLTDDHLEKINAYINSPSTATIIRNNKNSGGKIVTSEVIYFWMVSFKIPFDTENWHLNRLLTLIEICEIENKPKNKKSAKQVLTENAALNQARKKALNTTG